MVDWECTDGSEIWRGRVEVFNAHGLRLTILKLPHDMVNPQHVLQTVNKSFIVCHGDHVTELNRVCEVNSAGDIVKSYGGSRGSQLGQLYMPIHVALDSNEHIVVADAGNQRVVLFDRQLNTECNLLSWTDDGPWRLIFDTETAELAVGLQSGLVEIYNLRQVVSK
jgi:hypothetical protein